MSSSSSVSKSNKMPAAKKDSKIVAPTPVVAAPAPKVESKESKAKAEPKAAKATKAEKATPAKAEVTVPTVATPSAEPVVASPSVTSETQLAALAETLKALSTDLSTRVRDAVKAVQEAAKAAKREALVQRPLTDELCHFMGLKSGETRSQTQVTKFISEYVKTHSCFDPSFKRRILPNAALAKLLRVGDKDEVTYLNLQSFLKVHFIKTRSDCEIVLECYSTY
jgi:chromatin remodeling complex protein RSC6